MLNHMRCLRSTENKYHCCHTFDEPICFIPDGQGFTRERKTRLLQLEEERKEPQLIPSSRPMTTAEFAVVWEFVWKICCTTQTAFTKRKIYISCSVSLKKEGPVAYASFQTQFLLLIPLLCTLVFFLLSVTVRSEKAITAIKLREIRYMARI